MSRSLSNHIAAIGVAGFAATAFILFAQDAACLAALFSASPTPAAAPGGWSTPIENPPARDPRQI